MEGLNGQRSQGKSKKARGLVVDFLDFLTAKIKGKNRRVCYCRHVSVVLYTFFLLLVFF